jgi:DNA gyrase/topoisomerase IV subunit A
MVQQTLKRSFEMPGLQARIRAAQEELQSERERINALRSKIVQVTEQTAERREALLAAKEDPLEQAAVRRVKQMEVSIVVVCWMFCCDDDQAYAQNGLLVCVGYEFRLGIASHKCWSGFAFRARVNNNGNP